MCLFQISYREVIISRSDAPILINLPNKPKFNITPNSGDIDMACYDKKIDVALGHPRLTHVLLPMDRISNNVVQKSIKQPGQESTKQQRQLTETIKTNHGTTINIS